MNFISRLGTTEQEMTVDKESSTIICCTSDRYSVGGVRMRQAMSKEWNYFEVTITDTVEDGAIAIGIGHEKYLLSDMPGWDVGSIGYHSDDGGLFQEDGFPKQHGLTCSIGDKMGCGVDFAPSADGHVRVWFTKNDQVVFHPQTLEFPVNTAPKFYPLIGMQASGQKVQYMGHWQKAPPTENDSKPTFCLHACRYISGRLYLELCMYYALVVAGTHSI